MSDFNDLIHDARQVDLEEMIMTNETPMYLVPGKVTPEMERRAADVVFDKYGREILWTDFHAYMMAIVTPIQPCADVETVGWVDPDILAIVRKDKGLRGMTLANKKATSRTIPLVRRTDMEAQVARVAAEKDAEIARLRKALREIRDHQDGWSGCDEGDMIEGYCEMQEMARAALNEGAAG